MKAHRVQVNEDEGQTIRQGKENYAEHISLICVIITTAFLK